MIRRKAGTSEFPHQGCRAVARVRPPQECFQHQLRGRPGRTLSTSQGLAPVADLTVRLLLPLPLQAFRPPWPCFPKAFLTSPACGVSLLQRPVCRGSRRVNLGRA